MRVEIYEEQFVMKNTNNTRMSLQLKYSDKFLFMQDETSKYEFSSMCKWLSIAEGNHWYIQRVANLQPHAQTGWYSTDYWDSNS